MTANSLIRPATAEDADAVLELLLVCDIAKIGEPESTISEVTADLANTSFIAGVIDDPNGGLTGYVWVEHPPNHSLVWGDILVRPGADPALAAVLLDWLRERAAQFGPGLHLHVFAYTNDLARCALLEGAGGTVIRRSYRMVIEFDQATTFEVPELADGIEIRALTGTDAELHAMHRVVDVAFLDHFAHESEPYDEWLRRSVGGLCPDLSLWWLATVDGQPAAGLYSCELPTSGYVDTLGTLREFRGKGLARALLVTSFAQFHRRGVRKVTLGVDATNPTGALALYESAGMSVAHEGLRYALPM
jgi:mycothiol synthase